MPEWPDLHVLRGRLAEAFVGKHVTAVRVHDPLVLRATRPLPDALKGRALADVVHRGRVLVLVFDDNTRLVINPMLSGLFDIVPTEAKLRATTAFALTFDGIGSGGPLKDARDLRYRDETRMGKVYLLEPSATSAGVPAFDAQGPEAGALPWSAAEFARRAKATRRELRNLLMHSDFIAGIGNAYADEILWAASIHPYRKRPQLTAEEIDRLHPAMQTTLREAVDKVRARMGEQIHVEKRDFMAVHMKAGQPCPRCGTRISAVTANQRITNYCLTCQPGGLIKGM